MKKIFILIILFCILPVLSQNTPQKEQTDNATKQSDEFKISIVYRLYPISSLHFGNNVFAEAHENGGGFGTSLGLFQYGNIRAGFGYEYTSYSVSDVSKVGNFNFSNLQSFNYFISYDLKLTNHLMLVPNIGYGNDFVNQKTRSQSFGNYSGNHLKLGLHTDWELSSSIAAFVGVHYVYTKYDLKTNAAFEDFLQKSHQIQLTIGIKIF